MKNNRNRHLVISKNCSDRFSFPHSLPERSVCQTWIIQYKRPVRLFRNQGAIAFRKFTATKNFRKTSHSFFTKWQKLHAVGRFLEQIPDMIFPLDRAFSGFVSLSDVSTAVNNEISKVPSNLSTAAGGWRLHPFVQRMRCPAVDVNPCHQLERRRPILPDLCFDFGIWPGLLSHKLVTGKGEHLQSLESVFVVKLL